MAVTTSTPFRDAINAARATFVVLPFISEVEYVGVDKNSLYPREDDVISAPRRSAHSRPATYVSSSLLKSTALPLLSISVFARRNEAPKAAPIKCPLSNPPIADNVPAP